MIGKGDQNYVDQGFVEFEGEDRRARSDDSEEYIVPG